MKKKKKYRAKAKAPSLKRQWSLLSKQLREEKGRCEICGQTGRLNAHHILARSQYREYALEPQNILVVCCGCHTFRKHSCHRNSVWFAEWLKKHKPEQYRWVVKHM